MNLATLRDWPHAPTHRLGDAGAYIVTAGTYKKEHFFRNSERLAYLTQALLTLAEEYRWRLQAWPFSRITIILWPSLSGQNQ